MIINLELPDRVWGRLVSIADARGLKVATLVSDAVAGILTPTQHAETSEPEKTLSMHPQRKRFPEHESAQVNDFIRASLAKGVSAIEIAQHLEVTRGAIHYRINKFNLKEPA